MLVCIERVVGVEGAPQPLTCKEKDAMVEVFFNSLLSVG